jgi:DNA mismatch repair protein MutL
MSGIGSKALDEVRHKIWAYAACRSAVKFWDPLSIFEMHALLRDASLDYSATCPHGRPVVYDINLDELQKKYER